MLEEFSASQSPETIGTAEEITSRRQEAARLREAVNLAESHPSARNLTPNQRATLEHMRKAADSHDSVANMMELHHREAGGEPLLHASPPESVVTDPDLAHEMALAGDPHRTEAAKLREGVETAKADPAARYMTPDQRSTVAYFEDLSRSHDTQAERIEQRVADKHDQLTD